MMDTLLLGLLVAAMIFAVALVFFIPTREVTQPPEKQIVVWEVLFPGTSPAWGFFGGLALVVWFYLFVQDLFLFWKGCPYLISLIATPNLSASYGLPGKVTMQDTFRLINPSWVWVYLAPAVLFLVNLFMVLRARRRA